MPFRYIILATLLTLPVTGCGASSANPEPDMLPVARGIYLENYQDCSIVGGAGTRAVEYVGDRFILIGMDAPPMHRLGLVFDSVEQHPDGYHVRSSLDTVGLPADILQRMPSDAFAFRFIPRDDKHFTLETGTSSGGFSAPSLHKWCAEAST